MPKTPSSSSSPTPTPTGRPGSSRDRISTYGSRRSHHEPPCPPHPRTDDRRSVRSPGTALRHLRNHDARDLPGVVPAPRPPVPALHSPVDPAPVGEEGGRPHGLVTAWAAGPPDPDPGPGLRIQR